MAIRFISLKRALRIHKIVLDCYGGGEGIRDMRLLESALNMPRAGMGGEYFHHDEFEMAAACLYHIVMNHPFVDGNKRAGLGVALSFLRINGWRVVCGQREMTDMVLHVAEGRLDKPEIAAFLRKYGIKKS